MPPGTWYELPVNPEDTRRRAAVPERAAVPRVVPGGPLPGIEVPPQTLAQLAVAKMNAPTAARMILSPTSGKTYSNLPTFFRVTLSCRPEFGPGGMPYATDNARSGTGRHRVGGADSAEVSSSDNAARPETTGCGYLGSTQMGNGAGGEPGRRHPSTAARRSVTRPVEDHRDDDLAGLLGAGVTDGPPPAACNPVPGAALDGLNWTRNLNIHEIQSANGAG